MHKLLKCFLIILIVIGVVASISYYTYTHSRLYESRHPKVAFERYEKKFSVISDYLSELDFNYVSIDEADGWMNVGYMKRIDNDEVNEAIAWLFNKKWYDSIKKIGDTIQFNNSIGLNSSHGFVFVGQEGEEPLIWHLTKCEPMSKDGWFYYESDDNEWNSTS